MIQNKTLNENRKSGAGDIALWPGTGCSSRECCLTSIATRHLTTICISSFKGTGSLFCLPQVPDTRGAQTYIQTKDPCVCVCKINSVFSLKKIERKDGKKRKKADIIYCCVDYHIVVTLWLVSLIFSLLFLLLARWWCLDMVLISILTSSESHSNSPASVSWVLGLQIWATTDLAY